MKQPIMLNRGLRKETTTVLRLFFMMVVAVLCCLTVGCQGTTDEPSLPTKGENQ